MTDFEKTAFEKIAELLMPKGPRPPEDSGWAIANAVAAAMVDERDKNWFLDEVRKFESLFTSGTLNLEHYLFAIYTILKFKPQGKINFWLQVGSERVEIVDFTHSNAPGSRFRAPVFTSVNVLLEMMGPVTLRFVLTAGVNIVEELRRWLDAGAAREFVVFEEDVAKPPFIGTIRSLTLGQNGSVTIEVNC